MKPGYKTTEFWIAIISQALTVLVLLGVVTIGDAATLSDALGKIVGAVFALIASAAVVIAYIRGRVELKSLDEPPLPLSDRDPRGYDASTEDFPLRPA